MKDCNHHKYILTDLKKVFKGYTFEYRSERCNNCGATLWKNSINTEYNEWLNKLHSEKPELFYITITTDFILANLIDHLAYDLNYSKESLVTHLIDFGSREQLNYSNLLTEDHTKSIDIVFKFNPDDYNEIASFANLFQKESKYLLNTACKLSKIIVDDPIVLKKFKEFCT